MMMMRRRMMMMSFGCRFSSLQPWRNWRKGQMSPLVPLKKNMFSDIALWVWKIKDRLTLKAQKRSFRPLRIFLKVPAIFANFFSLYLHCIPIWPGEIAIYHGKIGTNIFLKAWECLLDRYQHRHTQLGSSLVSRWTSGGCGLAGSTPQRRLSWQVGSPVSVACPEGRDIHQQEVGRCCPSLNLRWQRRIPPFISFMFI